MFKVTIGTLVTIFLIIAALTVLYWRDIAFDPSARDLVFFFVLLPTIITTCVLSPLLIIKWMESKKKTAKSNEVIDEEQQGNEQRHIEKPAAEWLSVHLYSAFALHGFGENEEIILAIQESYSPELDPNLLNQYGNAVLSYRIKDLNEYAVEEQDSIQLELQHRLMALIKQQLEYHQSSFIYVIEHIKQATLFYDHQLAYEYKIHPAWTHAEGESILELNNEEKLQAPVDKLNVVNVHIILSNLLLNSFDEFECSEYVEEYLVALGIIRQQIKIHYHYWDASSSYVQWLDLLKNIEQQTEQFSCVITLDSELNQDVLDEKNIMLENYIPAEFTASCLLASSQLVIEKLTPEKIIYAVKYEENLINSLEYLNVKKSTQYALEKPFVAILDAIESPKVVKKLNNFFAESLIEEQHYLFAKSSLGHSQTLLKVWGVMLAMYIPNAEFSLVYSVEYYDTQLFILPFLNDSTPIHS